MNCPQCNSTECSRDEVDIGVGVQYGPWQCYSCGWYEGHEADATIDADREENKCLKCKGTGKSWDRLLECDACGGDGYIE